MGDLKKQIKLDSNAAESSSLLSTVKQLNNRLYDYLYAPNNLFVAQNLERFEKTTNMRREQVRFYGFID